MIQIENEVFDDIATALEAEFPGIDVSSEYDPTPAVFPHVSIEMTDSYSPSERETNSLIEKYNVCTFTVNVYSNKTAGRKQECAEILNFIEDHLRRKNFRRESRLPVPNLEDSTIYRITARYVVETDGTLFYRR